MIVAIENEFLRLDVNLSGGSMTSIFDKVTKSELLWQGDERFWKFQDVVIFPILGKPEGGFSVKGKTYSFEMAHGLARREIFEVLKKEKDEIEIGIRATSETMKNFPFNFSLKLNYKLSGRSFSLTYKVQNLGDGEMPYQVGAHAGINLTEGKTHLEFDEKTLVKYFPYSSGYCAENSEVLFEGKDFELTQELYREKGSLVLERMNASHITLVRGDGLKLRYALNDCTNITVWAFSGGGKFACVEPWWGLCAKKSTTNQLEKFENVNFVKDKERCHVYSCEII